MVADLGTVMPYLAAGGNAQIKGRRQPLQPASLACSSAQSGRKNSAEREKQSVRKPRARQFERPDIGPADIAAHLTQGHRPGRGRPRPVIEKREFPQDCASP